MAMRQGWRIAAIGWLGLKTLAVNTMLLSATIGSAVVEAQTYTVLHSFTGVDGVSPHRDLLRDSAGVLYGMTSGGGASGLGTVFKLDQSGVTVLHSFTRVDGAYPYASLIRDPSGNLYGTTLGTTTGVVFKVDTGGTETVLHNFLGRITGEAPHAGLVQDSAGNFYGTAILGGRSNDGVVFKLTP